MLGRGLILLVFLSVILPLEHGAQAGYADYVIDVRSGVVLRQTNAHTRNYPASLTKMMTLFMVFEALERGDLTMDTKLKVTRKAAGQPPSKLGLRAGETISVRNAILALATKSANDVATVVAEALGDNEQWFAKMMTDRARALGMSKTTFRNASGLPNRGQLTTAYDVSILARALFRDFPQYIDFFSVRKFTFRGRTYRNHNNLLGRYKGTNGIKTGYTRASGYNLAASVARGDHHLVAVVLGGKSGRSRDRQMRRLLDRGFASLARRDQMMAQVGRPVRKPGTARPQLLEAALGLKSIARPIPKPGATSVEASASRFTAEFEQAAVAVGAAITNYVRIPSAQAGDLETVGLWGIQVGAFSRQDAARTALDQAASALPQLIAASSPVILADKDKFGTLFRARYTGMDESEARSACSILEGAKVPCMVAPPKLLIAPTNRSDL